MSEERPELFKPLEADVYHRVPPNLTGETLYPLSALEQLHPGVAEVHWAKYTGREAVTQARIPPLECLWNDVLMLSPVHPALLLDALRQSGRPVPPQRWYAVDASLLNPARTTLFAPSFEQEGSFSETDYFPFTPATLRAHRLPSPRTLERLSSAPLEGKLALFADVPHVLYAGTLEVARLREIEV